MKELKILEELGVELDTAYMPYDDIHVIVRREGLNYSVHYVKDNEVIRSLEMGIDSGLAYYSASDIATQYPHLPNEFLLYI